MAMFVRMSFMQGWGEKLVVTSENLDYSVAAVIRDIAR